MYSLPLLSTLMSCIFSGTPISRFLGHRGSIIISIMYLGIATVSSIIIWYECIFGGLETSIDFFGTWFSLGSFDIRWDSYVDLYSAHLLLTVTIVSFAVHCYAVVYMKADPHLSLFMSYLSAFTFSMLILVSASNLLVMFLGFEGIGVCSFLLISYWSHRLTATKSATKAILVNRISDGLLLWSIIWIWWHTGSLDYNLILLNDANNIPSIISYTILAGCMAKSVQILFHVWLADSMEGPTPVSALIHAATLVTAGIYIMIRLNFVSNSIVLLVGSLTALMAGVFGLFQNDLKRVIAFSTCSQLGYMLTSVGLGEFGVEASMSHLMTHASFKAGLFLAAGVVMMSMSSYQHLGRYGGLTGLHCSLFGYLTLMLCGISLMGLPETSGFYSKETIINLSFVYSNSFADYAHTLLLISALITCTYTIKLLVQSFYFDFSGLDFNISPISKPSYILVTVALSILIIDIVFKIWIGTNLLSGILFFIPFVVKTLPVGLIIAGFLTSTSSVSSQNFSLIRFNATRWGFDQIYARTIVNTVFDWGRITFTLGDKGFYSVNNLTVRD